MSLPWFRVYSDILDDRKIKRICKKTGNSKAVVIGCWISLLALANSSPSRGELILAEEMPYTFQDLEDETGLDADTLNELLAEFAVMKMIEENPHIKIMNWGKRQFKSDNSSERVKKHREKRSLETLPKRSSNVLDTDTDTDTDTDEDGDNIYSRFSQVTGLLFSGKDDGDRFDLALDDFGEKRVFEIGAWCAEKKFSSMKAVLTTIDNKAPGWKQRPETNQEMLKRIALEDDDDEIPM